MTTQRERGSNRTTKKGEQKVEGEKKFSQTEEKDKKREEQVLHIHKNWTNTLHSFSSLNSPTNFYFFWIKKCVS